MSRSHEETHACAVSNEAASAQRRAHIRHLNDQLRMLFAGGMVMITAGVRGLPSDEFALAIRKVCRFADFSPDNDPYGEHDFGSVEMAGRRLFWKIDAYDKSLEAGSPDRADPTVTTRVLTIMLAEEY